MSETINYRIDIDAKGAAAQIDTLTSSLKEADKKSQEFIAKEKQRVKTLREEYRELRTVHEQLHADVLSGRATNRTKYQVGDQGKFTIKQLRERINLVKALMEIEEQNIRKNSFAKARRDYAGNLKAITEGKKLLRQIEDRSSEAAKKLSADIANATRRNASIEKRWGGYEGFGSFKQELLTDMRRRTTLGDAKRQAVEEGRKHTQELEKEAEWLKTLKARYKEYFNERIALEEKLKKIRDKNSTEYARGKDRLDTLNRNIKDIEYAGWKNKSFQDFHWDVQNKQGGKTTLNGLDTQIKSETKNFLPLSQRISEVKTKIGQLTYAYQKGSLEHRYYANGMRNLRKEYDLLKKAMSKVNDAVGRNNLGVFGANIRSHLHWLVSGALVDKLIEIPMAIKDIAVEFDNLERKITQNIELSGDFAGDHERLKAVSKHLVFSSFDIANENGMKMEDVMMMMQIMSRRFKDPAELKYFTNLAAVMSKLDFVEPAVAAETLESVILSFGLNAREAADFVNEFSIATHTMRINGQDLLEALQRSAPVLKQWGMSTADSVAMISTLSTTLGREGKYIGNAVTGIFSRLLTPKAKKIFDEIGLSIEKANGEAKSGSEIFGEYLDHYKTLSQTARKDELWNIFGTYRVTPTTSYVEAFDLFLEAREKIKNASDETTDALKGMQTQSHESKLNRFSNALSICAYVIGDVFAPAVADVLEFLTELITKVSLFGEYHKEMVEWIFNIVGALFTFRGILGLVNSRFGSFGMMCTTTKGKVIKLTSGLARLGINLISLVPASSRAGAALNALGSKAVGALAAISAAALGAIAVVSALNSLMNTWDQEERTQTILDHVQREYGDLDKIPEDQTELIKWRDNYRTMDQEQQNAKVFDYDSMAANMIGEKYTEAPERIKAHEKHTTELSDVIRTAENVRRAEELANQLNKNAQTYGTQDPAGTDSSDSDKAAKEARNKERRQKSILAALVSRYKTEAELSQKRYDSLSEDISFEQEIFGANPKNVSQSLYAKANRQDELRRQITSRDRFIEDLKGRFASKLGEFKDLPSANFNALQSEMGKTLGKTYESAGAYVKEMLAKVGVALSSDNAESQAKEFKDKNKFYTDISKIKLGDTVYWNGSDDVENKDINYTGTYMGGGAVRFAGQNGAVLVSLSDIKGLKGFGSTGVGDLKAEDLDNLGEDNPLAGILSEYLKKIDELEKLNESEREKIKSIGRELRRGYLISDDKRFEEQKERLKTEEETELLDNTNRRNAYNNMVLTNKKLEFAKRNLEVLQAEYKKAFDERADWAERLAQLEKESTEAMTAEQLEAHEIAVGTAKRNLELAKDTEAQKLLAVKKSNDEIEQLEYQRTQKIREGLHSVVHDLLLEGKSLKDVWSQLWSDLADEALRALMGIENGQQSTLGAIAAKAFGLDKENPNGEVDLKVQSIAGNTDATERNTAAIAGLTNTIGASQARESKSVEAVSNAVKGIEQKAESGKPVWADETDTVSSEELAKKDRSKDVMRSLTALGIVGAAASMSGSKKIQKFGALLSIGTAVMGRGKKLSHSGSVVGVTPMATRYYHNGGNVGTAVTPYLKSDEVNAVLQTGEEVVSRKDRRSNEILSEQNKYMADAMQRMAESSNTNVTFMVQAIDSKSVVQLLNEHGDAIMNVLRKQSAYGNGRI